MIPRRCSTGSLGILRFRASRIVRRQVTSSPMVRSNGRPCRPPSVGPLRARTFDPGGTLNAGTGKRHALAQSLTFFKIASCRSTTSGKACSTKPPSAWHCSSETSATGTSLAGSIIDWPLRIEHPILVRVGELWRPRYSSRWQKSPGPVRSYGACSSPICCWPLTRHASGGSPPELR